MVSLSRAVTVAFILNPSAIQELTMDCITIAAIALGLRLA